MRNEVIEEVAKHISDSYYDVLLVAFEEQKHKLNFRRTFSKKFVFY